MDVPLVKVYYDTEGEVNCTCGQTTQWQKEIYVMSKSEHICTWYTWHIFSSLSNVESNNSIGITAHAMLIYVYFLQTNMANMFPNLVISTELSLTSI
jgi:hypothetical protein